MPNSLTLATDGMLQEDGADGCVKVVVRENEKTTVVRTNNPANSVVAQPQTNTAVVSHVTQTVETNPVAVVSANRQTNTNTITLTYAGPPGADGQDGADGAPGINGIDGVDGESDKNYRHVQTTPLSVWTIVHGLNKFPALNVVDSGGTEVVGDVVYVSNTTITVSFIAAFSGEAYCN